MFDPICVRFGEVCLRPELELRKISFQKFWHLRLTCAHHRPQFSASTLGELFFQSFGKLCKAVNLKTLQAAEQGTVDEFTQTTVPNTVVEALESNSENNEVEES